MITFENHYNDLKIVQKLIKSGNKYLHQYIAENKHSNSKILTMLLASVKTKKLQKEIPTRLDKISHGTDLICTLIFPASSTNEKPVSILPR
ncbi:unnamed protein product [Commensalibacter communis]|nr:unnamed protein product [Commensalibacter communis]